jgi:SPP1 gp7 family putative phage head morphogenesis protein
MAKLKFRTREIDALIERIFAGIVTPMELPKALYLEIAEILKSGLYQGFNADLNTFDRGSLKGTLIGEMRENIYIFSGAKTFQQTLEMSDALYEGEKIKPFSVFKKDARDIFDKYNENYLSTEYETAIGQGQSAEKWGDIEANKDTLKYLRYNAIIDERTSDICASLNGLTLPVGDKRWDTCAPINHFRCRCILDQLEEATPMKKGESQKMFDIAVALMDDTFKFNPGKTGEVFSKDHPYFSVPKQYKEHALNNFGLPIPKRDRKK